jgi:hypothetical protein
MEFVGARQGETPRRSPTAEYSPSNVPKHTPYFAIDPLTFNAGVANSDTSYRLPDL